MIELGFIHGRFQLFHNDHLRYALLAKEQCKKLIVGITSPENASLIREEVSKIATPCGGLCMTYGLYPGVPLENVKAVMDAMEKYSLYFS